MHNYLVQLLQDALTDLNAELSNHTLTIEKPRSPEHGDAATNVAMTLAKVLRKSPLAIATDIVSRIHDPEGYLAAIEVAPPGFINFRFSDTWIIGQLSDAIEQGAHFGQNNSLQNTRIQVEFVSANPTGPLTVGHGRNAVLGDTMARLLEWSGAHVQREYYFNNAGRQMRVLAQSVQARYLELLEMESTFPEDGYQGAYITDIARGLVEQHGNSLVGEEHLDLFKSTAEQAIFDEIQKTLLRMNISMDTFFNENTLYEDGSIDKVLQTLRNKELVYEADGATWFRTTQFGKDKDTVLVKSTGEPTYRLPDIAYHIHKLERGFDLAMDIFGADHIATYPDVLAAVQACGYDPEKIDVVVYQFVTIVKDGKPFKMSTRKANYVTLDELMDEVGADVTRFFFLMRSPGTHLEFDIDEARQAGEKNPVYYLQYAHARIKSILRKVPELALNPQYDHVQLLTHPSELLLIKRIIEFPDIVAQAARLREPHKLIHFLNELAAAFHRFYHDCRILGEEEKLAGARTTLLHTTATVLANGLGILGIQAPDQM